MCTHCPHTLCSQQHIGSVVVDVPSPNVDALMEKLKEHGRRGAVLCVMPCVHCVRTRKSVGVLLTSRIIAHSDSQVLASTPVQLPPLSARGVIPHGNNLMCVVCVWCACVFACVCLLTCMCAHSVGLE
jgi:hypothetical protein